ncbi:MAG: 4-alpha-glucanotransferase [Ruminococcaceae bacterium]|nr:4-alpha-glucanotransferase [Oscillospiraceae bacterium]
MEKQERFARGAGILLPIFSLPSKFGIGAFDSAAYNFVDFLKMSGQKYWQILPLNPTGFADSPYQSSCAFAGNPYFLDISKILPHDTAHHLETEFSEHIDYFELFQNRAKILRQNFSGIPQEIKNEYSTFCKENEFWLEDYSLFMAIKERNNYKPWLEWEYEDLKRHDEEAIKEFLSENRDEIEFWKYVQYLFFSQWHSLKSYANENGITVIGDLPIYVSLDSSDVWANRQLFLLNEEGYPLEVAGVPPDSFSNDGQLWGNPIYDWNEMKKDGYMWWKRRLQLSSVLYDAVRIDHFIGFVNYYSIPYGAHDAKNGEWKRGPGKHLIDSWRDIGNIKIIAEDLGNVTDEVGELMKDAGFPGMKILQFAFTSGYDNRHLPHNFEENSVIYGGTHDNQTLLGYFSVCDNRELEFACDYFNIENKSPAAISEEIIRAGLESRADIAIFSLQDYLGLDDSARINTPSVLEGNWRWRVSEKLLTQELSDKIRERCVKYGR